MSFSDFYASDLSDITSSDDDEEFTPVKVKRTGTNTHKRDQRPYTIANPLRPPRSTSYSIRALYGSSFFFHSRPSYCIHSLSRTNRRWVDQFRSRLSAGYASHSLLSTDLTRHSRGIDVVWAEQKQIGLIDSVFRNYYIPPIIFGQSPVFPLSSHVSQILSKAVSTSEDGSEARVCIDGKQRLTSIQR